MDDRVFRRLLAADPAELDGSADTETARILQRDPDSRTAARRILGAMHEIDDALNSIVTDAHPGASSGRLHTKPRRPGNASMPGRAGRGLWAAGLAAAALAVFAITTHDGGPVTPTTGARSTSVTAQLHASSSRSFAVFATDNPDMAIMWLFDQEER